MSPQFQFHKMKKMNLRRLRPKLKLSMLLNRKSSGRKQISAHTKQRKRKRTLAAERKSEASD